jgi:hypothetical protein
MDKFEENFDRIFRKEKDGASEQRKDVNGVPDRGNDKRPAAQGSDVQTTGKPSA